MMDDSDKIQYRVASTHGDRSPGLAAHDLSVPQRLLVMALNYIPLLHVVATVLVAIWPWGDVAWPWRALAAVGTLYLAPPLAAWVIVKGFPIRAHVLKIGSADFFKWWALLNFQMVFSRMPMLEESLRMVPSAYSAWVRLWGSRIGRLVFWAPGTRILDRSFLDIGDDVIFGVGVQLIPHIMTRNADGRNEVTLATVIVGSRAVVGGYSLLSPGTEIAADESPQARLLLHPFTKWQGGRRVKE